MRRSVALAGARAVDVDHRVEHRPQVRIPQRNLAQGTDIAGHILAGAAVAAGGGKNKHALFVTQADRQSVELELGGIDHRRRRVVQPQRPTHARIEGNRPLVGRVGFGANRQHRHRMLHRRKLGGRLAAHTLGGRIGTDQFGMGRLQRLKFTEQPVVLGVRHRWIVEYVIGVVVTLQLRAQSVDPRTDFRACHHQSVPLRRTDAEPAASPGRCPARSS